MASWDGTITAGKNWHLKWCSKSFERKSGLPITPLLVNCLRMALSPNKAKLRFLKRYCPRKFLRLFSYFPAALEKKMSAWLNVFWKFSILGFSLATHYPNTPKMEHTFLECPYPFYYFFQNKWVHVLSCTEIHALKQQGAAHHCGLKSKRNMIPIAAHNSRASRCHMPECDMWHLQQNNILYNVQCSSHPNLSSFSLFHAFLFFAPLPTKIWGSIWSHWARFRPF